jgi:hypothetical protein
MFVHTSTFWPIYLPQTNSFYSWQTPFLFNRVKSEWKGHNAFSCSDDIYLIWQNYGAWPNIQLVSYITNRGQRECELSHVRKMHIFILCPLCPVSRRCTSVLHLRVKYMWIISTQMKNFQDTQVTDVLWKEGIRANTVKFSLNVSVFIAVKEKYELIWNEYLFLGTDIHNSRVCKESSDSCQNITSYW